jgi:hypothetical protein
LRCWQNEAPAVSSIKKKAVLVFDLYAKVGIIYLKVANGLLQQEVLKFNG